MKRFITRVLEHKIFQASVCVKGIYGLLETLAGIIILIISQRSITRFAQMLFGHELLEDPRDFFGNLFMNAATNLSVRMHIFVGIYIIVHGLANVGIALALYYKKRWAFPTVGVLMVLFIIYQIYTVVHTFSIVMILLTITDIAILSLLRFEYNRTYKKKSS